MASGAISYTTEMSAKQQSQRLRHKTRQNDPRRAGTAFSSHLGSRLLNLHSPGKGAPLSTVHAAETASERPAGLQQAQAESEPQSLILRQEANLGPSEVPPWSGFGKTRACI